MPPTASGLASSGSATRPSEEAGPSNILGVGVSAVDMASAIRRIEGWIRSRDRQYVCVTGVHGVMESQQDSELRAIHNRAGMVTPDGMPLVWLSRLKGHRGVRRVYGPDLMLACCEASVAPGYRHYLYGGAPGVADLLATRLVTRFPGLAIAGTWSPPFRPLSASERGEVADRINDARPDIVWIGLSTPKQERWMADNRASIAAPVLIGVGAAFDFHAGLKRQAPRWMQRSGLEWLFRLMTEPRRLWRRYLLNNPRFIWAVLMQSLGFRRYDL